MELRAHTTSHPSSLSKHLAEVLGLLQDLHRSEDDKKIGGVCGGLGQSTPIPAWTWRALFITSVLIFGVGFLPYIILWATLPERASWE